MLVHTWYIGTYLVYHLHVPWYISPVYLVCNISIPWYVGTYLVYDPSVPWYIGTYLVYHLHVPWYISLVYLVCNICIPWYVGTYLVYTMVSWYMSGVSFSVPGMLVHTWY